MTGTRIKGAVGVGLALAVAVSLVASTGAAGMLAAHSPAADDVQSQMNNSTEANATTNESANTSAPSPQVVGTLNNSTMAELSEEELVTRALELQQAITATQEQYVKQIRALQLQLNAAQQGNDSDAPGALPSANQSVMNPTQQGQSEGMYLNESALNELSRDQLETRILELQEVETQTSQQYLKQVRALQLQLNDAQNQTTTEENTTEAAAPTASVTFDNQTSEGTSVTVESVTMSEGGFVTIHNSSGGVVGVSEVLSAGTHETVEITLFEVPGQNYPEEMRLEANQSLIAMPHLDTNTTGEYEFVSSGGAADAPYTANGSAVVDAAFVTVTTEPSAENGGNGKAKSGNGKAKAGSGNRMG